MEIIFEVPLYRMEAGEMTCSELQTEDFSEFDAWHDALTHPEYKTGDLPHIGELENPNPEFVEALFDAHFADNLDEFCEWVHDAIGGYAVTYNDFLERFQGHFDNEAAFAQYYAAHVDCKSATELQYMDFQAYWEGELTHGYIYHENERFVSQNW